MPFSVEFLVACGAAVLAGAWAGWLFFRHRPLRAELRRLEKRAEELADSNWELKESEERARSFLEAQGDFILRRDAAGLITYANDAFCQLAGRERATLLGSDFVLPVLEQGDSAITADGTRMHDQKV